MLEPRSSARRQSLMTRRQLLLLGGFSLLAPSAALGQDPHTPFTDWVRRFYLAQLAARARREGWASAETEAGADAGLEFPFREYLTPEMQALYARTPGETATASDAPDGPILDVLFGWGALPNRPIRVLGVEAAPWWQSLGDDHMAVITLDIAGNERVLTLKGHYDAPVFNWEIADIDYGDGSDETLRERLERLAG